MVNPDRISEKAHKFTESVIREMTRLAAEYDAINLAQGFPNFPAPEFIKDAACRAIQHDINQYAITWGSRNLRSAVAAKYKRFYDWQIDPDTQVTICCGSTECMIASMLALINPGENVLVFEPFYENYGPDTIISGAHPVFVPLDPMDNWRFEPKEMERKINSCPSGVRALVLNSPNNPTGKVFALDELQEIARLANKYDFYVLTDEIYEHILYEGNTHYPIALLPGMEDRTVTISALSKTFSVTGWRIGYIVAPEDLSTAIRKMHDFLTVGAAAPLQEAAAEALAVGHEYYSILSSDYRERRDILLDILAEVGFSTWTPQGAYYIMADISPVTDESDVAFVRRLIADYGVAAVPGSSFYSEPEKGRNLIRFTFCKTKELLQDVRYRLRPLTGNQV